MNTRNPPPQLILKDVSQGEKSFSIDKPELIIGREPGVDILIDAQGVSRRHARLSVQGGQIVLEDLGSSNGTFISEERISSPRRLKQGDQIRLGRTILLEYRDFQPTASETRLEAALPTADVTRVEGKPDAGGTFVEGKPVSAGETMIGEEPMVSPAAVQPQLIVAIAGERVSTYTLRLPRISIGRAEDNQIVVNSKIISRYHAYLERAKTGYQLVVLAEAGNPVLLEGRPLTAPHQLRHGEILRIGSQDPGMMVTLTYVNPAQAAEGEVAPIRFGEKTLIQIGRDPGNDVVLDSPAVSRFHAQIERVGQRYRLLDLRSGNGTFVNDQRVEREVWLQPEDEIRIGRHRFLMGQETLAQYDETHGLRVEAVNLNKWVRKDINILKNISLVFQPREFIVVVGQSGGGKSTLVDAIAGYRPATHGMVLVNGTNVYQNPDIIHNDIGYVPQRDIIHYELTVYQALDYAAKLRMPSDASPAERHQRIMEVLADLDMVERKDSPISRLSGGQIKRVSIGVELLTKPGLFFLDEPTSGLDPGTETAFMHLMRRLADQGRTIIMVTHATKNVMLADKVVFLARGGYLTWFGPPEEALSYFDQFRTERERRTKEMDFDQIYSILDDPSRGSAKEWAQRFLEHPAYQKYIAGALQATQSKLAQGEVAELATRQPSPKVKHTTRVSGLRQFLILSARNVKILTRDRTSLMLMLLAPFLIGSIDYLLAPLMGREPFNNLTGNGPNAAITLFLVTIDSLLVAGFSQMREFIKEADVYKRERLVNLKIFPYVFSKVWVALLLAFYQAAAFTLIHFTAFKMPGGTLELGLFYATLVLGSFAGMMTGLLASAISNTASAAPLLMILLIVPQIVLSGALAPVPETVSAIASTRWTYQGFIGISGMGSDIKADPCWLLPDEQRSAMTIDDKAKAGCRCMGVAIFTPVPCNFPGVGQFFKDEIILPAPTEPAPLGNKPADPVIPPAPETPKDQNDQVAMVQYLNALSAYQDEIKKIQADYKSQMTLYESQATLYQAQMTDYSTQRLEYETIRNKAVNMAEGLIKSVNEKYNWAFVDKSSSANYWRWMLKVWGAHLTIIAVYIVIILVLFKRKDA